MNNNYYIKKVRKTFKIIAETTLGENYDTQKDLFSFENNYFNFYIIKYIESTIEKEIMFAEINTDNYDLVIEKDFREQTLYDMNLSGLSAIQTVEYLTYKNIFDTSFCREDKLVKASFHLKPTSPDLYAEFWLKKEYSEGLKTFSQTQSEILQFDSAILNASIYDFSEIIKNVNDEQFTSNLNQVLATYNEGWFYVAASAIGGLIENLLYKTAVNYGKTDFKRTNDKLTKLDYVQKLRELRRFTQDFPEDQKINFTDLDELTLDRDYLTRNAVSHYNSGFVNKNEVHSLFRALKDTYTRYFLPSFNYYIKQYQDD